MKITIAVLFFILLAGELRAQQDSTVELSLTVALQRGRVEEATKICSDYADSIKKANGDRTVQYARAMQLYVELFTAHVNIPMAEQYYSDAEEIFKGSGKVLKEDKLVQEYLRGHIQYLKNNLLSAKDIIGQVIEGYKEEGKYNTTNCAASIDLLFVIYYRLGNYNTAAYYNDEAISILAPLKSNKLALIMYGQALINRAGIMLNIGSYNKCLEHDEEIKRIYTDKLGYDYINYVSYFGTIGEMFRKTENYDKSLSYNLTGLYLTNKYARNPILAMNYLSNITLAYDKTGKADSALYYTRLAAAQMAQIGGLPPYYHAQLCSNLALVEMKHGDRKLADSLNYVAESVFKALKDTVSDRYATFLQNWAIAKLLAGAKETALHMLAKSNQLSLYHIKSSLFGLSAEEKFRLVESFKLKLMALANLAYQLTPDSLTLHELYQQELLLKGMVLQDERTKINRINKSKDPVLKEKLEQWITNKSLLSRIRLAGMRMSNKEIDSIAREAELQEKNLYQFISLKTLTNVQSATPYDVQKMLGTKDIVIEYIRFLPINLRTGIWENEYRYAALIVGKKDNDIRFIPLCRESALKNLLQWEKDTLEIAQVQRLYPNRSNAHKQKITDGDRLYELIWKPIEKVLTNYDTVYIVPNHMLHKVVFQALPWGKNGYLSDRYTLRTLLSSGSIAKQEDSWQPAISNINIWGNINYNIATADTSKKHNIALTTNKIYADCLLNDKQLQSITRPIPGSRSEIDSIVLLLNKKFRCVVDSGSNATESAFISKMTGTYHLLHISTHGFFFSRKNCDTVENDKVSLSPYAIMYKSGLAMAGAEKLASNKSQAGADGLLTALEISHLDMTQTRLVVLAACQTGLGEIANTEGVLGLQRAFKLAGADKIIVSNWKVRNSTTQEMMRLFYRYYTQGNDIRSAFEYAQRIIRSKYQAPFYWASFQLIE
jgi:CHAT domain-containing protein